VRGDSKSVHFLGLLDASATQVRAATSGTLLSLSFTEEMHEKPTDQDMFFLNLTMRKRQTM
jgi:hypothetical protein